MNQHPLELIRQFNSYEVGDIGVSCITVSELQYGASKSRQKQKNQYRPERIPIEVEQYQEATKLCHQWCQDLP